MAAFGRRCGVPGRATFRRYVLRQRMPPPEVIVAAYLQSKGLVTPADWYDLPEVQPELPLDRRAA